MQEKATRKSGPRSTVRATRAGEAADEKGLSTTGERAKTRSGRARPGIGPAGAPHLSGDELGDRPEIGLRDVAGYASHGVRVFAQRDGVAHRALEVRGLQKGDKRLGHRALTGDVEAVSGANDIQSPCKITDE